MINLQEYANRIKNKYNTNELNIEIKGNNCFKLIFGAKTYNRKQNVYVKKFGKYLHFVSVVLDKEGVRKKGEIAMIQEAWERNNSIDLVEFMLDEKGRLIGRIEQLYEFLDYEEFEFYILTLARECDRYEYVLIGEDLN